MMKVPPDTTTAAKSASAAPIRLLDLPDFQKAEDRLLLYTSHRGEISTELRDFIDELSKRTFGITVIDTLFEYPQGWNDLPEWSAEWEEIEDRFDAHEDQFETSDANIDEAVEILLRLGLDFRDLRGAPLRCTKFFCRQAEAAAKGIMGKMPDRAAAGLESWERSLKRDAERHLKKKRSNFG